MKHEWQELGGCAVDSGTLVVVDPCYVDADDSLDLVGPYDAPDDWQPKALVQQESGPGASYVRLSHFGGDGVYPVYVQRDERGLVRAALVIFSGEDPADIVGHE